MSIETPVLLHGSIAELYYSPNKIDAFKQEDNAVFAIEHNNWYPYPDGTIVIVRNAVGPKRNEARVLGVLAGKPKPMREKADSYTTRVTVIAWIDDNETDGERGIVDEKEDIELATLETIIDEPFVWWAAHTPDDAGLPIIVDCLRKAAHASSRGAKVYASFVAAVEIIKIAKTTLVV
jgi:hypothetical protein